MNPKLEKNLTKARSLAEKGQLNRALETLKKTRASTLPAPEQARYFCELGSLQEKLLQTSQAIRALEKAVQLDPRFATAYARLALLYYNSHQPEKALPLLKQAIHRFGPINEFLHIRALCLHLEDNNTEALAVLESIDKNRCSDELRLKVCDTLGKVLVKLGDHQAAWRSYVEANAIARKKVNLQQNGVLFDIGDLARNLPADLSQPGRLPEFPSLAFTPVFLIGFPRSGTTLLDQVLDAHPDMVSIEEKPTVTDIRNQLVKQSGSLSAALAGLDEKSRLHYRKRYEKLALGFAPEARGKILVDKMPLNIIFVPLIRELIPEARFLVALRHPLDCCLSSFMHIFQANDAMNILTSIDDTVALYRDIFTLWNRYREWDDLNYCYVRYEDMVSDMETQVSKLCQFLGTEVDDNMFRFHEHARQRAIRTPSYTQVTQPLYTSSRYRWRHYREELSPYVLTLKPFIEQFGYPFPEPLPDPLPETTT